MTTTLTRDATRSPVRYSARLADLTPDERRTLTTRSSEADVGIVATTARIIADVRARGDAALAILAMELDGADLDAFEVPRARIDRALAGIDVETRRALERAAANLESVHSAFMPRPMETSPEPGIVVGRRPDPLARVGIYAPGGRAVYPSSVLMAAIPARVARVGEVILASPPRADGGPADVVLAAAAIAGVDRVFALGGAGAIAAMALGTQTVPRVDRVVGPGNAYVAAAKVALSGEVGIDCAAGPSELLIIADGTASASRLADELLAQAEHDPMACVVAIVLDAGLAAAVGGELSSRTETMPRSGIAQQALAASGAVLVADSIDAALDFASEYAPEHLLLVLRDSDQALARIRNAGTVFVGDTSSVVFGDYMTGANHVLPTGGTARWASGLSPLDFVRWTTYQRVEAAAARSLAADVSLLAGCEGLPNHARAALSAAEAGR